MATFSRNMFQITRRLSYQSAISLKYLYPTSSLQLTTPTQPNYVASNQFSGVIPIDKLDVTYSRSSGPGGQNVNTVSTKVDVRFQVSIAEWLDPDIRRILIENNRTRISKDGYLIVRSELTRSQQLNLADALEKLRTMIRSAAAPLTAKNPATEMMLEKRLERNNRERVLVKRHKSQTKRDRQAPNVFDI